MSRVGKQLIELNNCKATMSERIRQMDANLEITGPLGSLKIAIPYFVEIKQEDNKLSVTVADKDDKHQRSMWGTINRLVKNAVQGVSNGFTRKLIVSQGYAMDIVDGCIAFKVGLSHPLSVKLLDKMVANKKQNTEIELKHFDKQALNQFIARICRLRKVNPYTGKGIWADNMFVLKKEVVKQ